MSRATKPGRSCSAATPGLLHKKGWHPTGLYGAVGAAAACASLRRLDADKAAQAIALGASQSAGLMANFGTMTKPFHAGKAAHAGIMAARLAEAGFTANTDALEHPQGFLSAISVEGNPRPRQRIEGRQGMGDPVAGHRHQEIPDLLLHASRHRLHAGPGRAPIRSAPTR